MRIMATKFYSVKTNASALVFTAFSLTMIPYSFADNVVSLTAKPERCVALNEGQICYQKTLLTWQTEKIADYCLFESDRKEPITCWLNTNQGQAKIDFASETTKKYQLTLKKIEDPIASTKVEVTWVYSKKKKRRTSWRLF